MHFNNVVSFPNTGMPETCGIDDLKFDDSLLWDYD